MNHFDSEYGKRPFLFGKEMTPELKFVVERYKLKGKALELGCGDGRDTAHMLKYGFSIDAIEQSPAACHTLATRKDICSDERTRLKIICSDVESVTVAKDFYDFVYGVTLLDHLKPYVGNCVLKAVLESLKGGGHLFLKVHTVNDVGNTHLCENISEFSSEIQHFYAENELLDRLRDFGPILFYIEASEDDFDHGPPHTHSFASILLRKDVKK